LASACFKDNVKTMLDFLLKYNIVYTSLDGPHFSAENLENLKFAPEIHIKSKTEKQQSTIEVLSLNESSPNTRSL
jgi:hypothetical protein